MEQLLQTLQNGYCHLICSIFPSPWLLDLAKKAFFFHTCSFTISFYEEHCTAQDFVDTLKDVFSTVSLKCLELTNTKISKNPQKK